MLPQKSTVPASMSHAGGGTQLAGAARETDERYRNDAEPVKELELHGRLEAAQRLLVGERQRVAADGAGDRRHEQRDGRRATAAIRLSRHCSS